MESERGAAKNIPITFSSLFLAPFVVLVVKSLS